LCPEVKWRKPRNSPAPPVVVEYWCLMVETMNRVRLDRFMRETWRKFDEKDLEDGRHPRPRRLEL